MVNFKISIYGDKELYSYLAQLPKKVQKSVFNESSMFMKDMQKNMIMMAPEATGFLKSQINYSSNGKDTITIDTGDAYYGVFQEIGFAAHSIPIKYMSQHLLAPSLPGIPTTGPFVTVSKNTPFVEPAFNQAILQLNSKLNIALERAI